LADCIVDDLLQRVFCFGHRRTLRLGSGQIVAFRDLLDLCYVTVLIVDQ
jgi:hypothetical protein